MFEVGEWFEGDQSVGQVLQRQSSVVDLTFEHDDLSNGSIDGLIEKDPKIHSIKSVGSDRVDGIFELNNIEKTEKHCLFWRNALSLVIE